MSNKIYERNAFTDYSATAEQKKISKKKAKWKVKKTEKSIKKEKFLTFSVNNCKRR